MNGPAEARFYAWRPDGGASQLTTFRLCECGRGDLNGDYVADAVDLNILIDVLFFNGVLPDVYPVCPAGANGDLNCDGAMDSVDLNAMIDYVVLSGPMPCDPCQ